MRTLLLTGKWWVRHLLVVAAVVACALLGRWQFDKGVFGSGDLINLGYGLQWWSFAAIIVFGWWRAIRHVLHPKVGPADASAAHVHPPVQVPSRAAAEPAVTAPAVAAERSVPVPASLFAGRRPRPDAAGNDDDPELAAYNAYLARLNARTR